jgi:lipopolysaccharide export system protein LptA
MTYTGNVDTVVEADTGLVRILAASGAGNADRMTYKKDAQQVQLWRQTDNVYIKSDLLDVWPKEKRFTAEGTVHSEMKDVVGDSASLDYRDVRDGAPATARYSGNARLIQKDMTITASTVTAGLKDGRVSEATAVGGVRMTQGGRVGVGDQAVYNAEKDNAILTGRPATVSDPVKGNTQGPTVTMELSTKNATIVGASEELPQGRVRTRTNVGK